MVEWNQFLNKKLRIVQKDNFIKSGILKREDGDFLVLLFDTGNENYLKKDFIQSFEVIE